MPLAPEEEDGTAFHGYGIWQIKTWKVGMTGPFFRHQGIYNFPEWGLYLGP